MAKTATKKVKSDGKSRKKTSERVTKKGSHITAATATATAAANKSKIKKRARRPASKPTATKSAQKTSSRSASKKHQQDIHVIHAIKTEAKVLKNQLLQYMDSGGYVSWSSKKRQYAIFGTNSAKDGLVPCPKCGVGQLHVVKSPKSGKRFIGCTNYYGGCDASSPLLQKAKLRATKKACKICKWPEVIFRYSSKQKWTRQCSNIACPSRTQARSDG